MARPTSSCGFVGLFSQHMPIAMHQPMGQVVPNQPMFGDWHRLAKLASKRHLHKQQWEAAGCPFLSIVENLKIYFDYNTLFFMCGSTMILN